MRYLLYILPLLAALGAHAKVLDPRWFGADSTGTADSITALQDLHTEAADGDIIELNGGTFEVAGTWTISKALVIRGPGTITEATALAPVIEITADRVQLHDVTVAGAEAIGTWNTTVSTIHDRAGIHVNGADDVLISRTRVTDKSTGIKITAANRTALRDILWQGIDLSSQPSNYAESAGLRTVSGLDLLVSGGSWTLGGRGMALEGVTTARLAVSGATIYGCESDGIYINDPSGVQILGGYIQGVDGYGIHVEDGDTLTISDAYARSSALASCYLGTGTVEGVTVSDCDLVTLLFGAGTFTDVIFTGGRIDELDWDAGATYSGVVVSDALLATIETPIPSGVVLRNNHGDPSEDLVGIGTVAPKVKLDVADDSIRIRNKTTATPPTTGEQGEVVWGDASLSVFTATDTAATVSYDRGIDVRTYGAIPDDGTDDWVAIQAAINDAASTGRHVSLPPGDLHVSAPLELKPYLQIRGAGRYTSWIVATTAGMDAISNTEAARKWYVTLQDFGVRAGAGVHAGTGINMEHVTDFLVQNVSVLPGDTGGGTEYVNGGATSGFDVGIRVYGDNIDGGAWRGVIDNVLIATWRGNSSRGILLDGSPAGYGPNSTRIINSNIQAYSGIAIRVDDANSVWIAGNVFEGSSDSAVYLNDGSSKCWVIGNRFENDGGQYGVTIVNSEHHTVLANYFDDSGITPYQLSLGGNQANYLEDANTWDDNFEFDGDATPSVAGARIVRINDSSANTITDFDDGYNGQRLIVYVKTANTTFQEFRNGGNFQFWDNVNHTPPANSILEFMKIGSQWWNVSISPLDTADITVEYDGDATPDVERVRTVRINDSSANTITDFDGGVDGQELLVFVKTANTTFADASTTGALQLVGGVDYLAPTTSFILFRKVSTFWYEVARAVNGPNDKTKTVSADRGDAGVALDWGGDDKTQRFDTTFTSDHTVTLNTGNTPEGATFRIVRTAGGAFSLNVGTGPLKVLSAPGWCDVTFDGSAWFLSASGSL